MGDLTTVDHAKRWLNVTGTTDDGLLAQLVTQSSRWFETQCSVTFAQADYTELHSGRGGSVLAFRHTPVTAVSSLMVGTTTIAARATVGGAGYTFDEHFLYLCGHTFWPGRQNVSVTLTAGFAATPSDVEDAVCALVGLQYRERDRIGMSSKSIQGETTAFLVRQLPLHVQQTLDAYRRPPVPVLT